MTDYSLYEALSNAAKIKPTRNESAENFSKRIVKALAADDFPEDDWEALPDEGQQWVNEQIRATNERKDITPLPGYGAFYEANHIPNKRFKSVTEPTEDTVAEETASINVFEEEAEPKKDTKKPNGKVARTPPPEGKPNAVYRMREMLIDDFSVTPNELMERLVTEGYREISRLTATSVKADLRTTIKFLQDKGLLTRQILA